MARPRKFDEAVVLDQARDAFWSTGYAGTSTSDLVQVTGLGKGSLYGAFGDKQALFIRVFRDYCARLVEAAREVLTRPDSEPVAMVADFLLRSAATTTDPARRGCMLTNVTAELSGRDPTVAELAKRTLRTVEDLLDDVIGRGQRDGRIGAHAPSRELAGLVLTISRGLDALAKADLSTAELTAVAETAVSVVLRPAS